MKILLVVSVLAFSVLACGQYVPTVTPTASPTHPPAATHTASPTETASPAPSGDDNETATVKAATVNVRQTPNGKVIGQLTAGQDVTVISCVSDWCEVRTDDLSGFVFQGCLSIADGQGCEAK